MQEISSKPYTMLEHTGDIMMRITGKNLPELFVHAGRGLMEYLYGEKIFEMAPVEQKTITLASLDQESLLVDWLSELLYINDISNKACVACAIRELSDTRLCADVELVPAKAIEDVKAVTYHELLIRKTNDHYEANVVFDI